VRLLGFPAHAVPSKPTELPCFPIISNMKTYYEALVRKRMATKILKLIKTVCDISNIPSMFSRQTGQFLVSLCQSTCYLLLELKKNYIIQKQASVVRLRVGYMKSNYT